MALPRPSQKTMISGWVLAMMNVAICVGVEGLPTMATFGLSLVSWYLIFGFVFLIPVGLVAAELGAGFPGSGGVYNWVRLALGERAAFVAVWCQWIQVVIWYPSVLVVAAVAAANIVAPDLAQNTAFLIPAIISIFFIATLVNLPGLKFSGMLISGCLWVGTLLPILLIISLAAIWLADGHPSATPLSMSELVPRVDSLGQMVIVFTVISFLSGLEANSVHFRHAKNLRRSVPFSIFLAAGVVLAISILGSLSVAIVVPRSHLELDDGPLQVFKLFADDYSIGWVMPIASLCVLVGMIGHMVVWIIAPSEALRVAAKDGLIPPLLQRVNGKGVPVTLLILQAVIVTALSLVFVAFGLNAAFYIITVASAQIYLVMYGLMFLAAIVLRHRKPDVERPYRIPGGVFGLYGVAGLGMATAIIGISLMFVPPESDALAVKPDQFVSFVVPAFVVLLGIPFLVYAFRKPHWKTRDASEPDA